MDRPAKIIVLDDEAELRNMLQRFLRSHGFEVRIAEDGKRLDRYLEREPFDLLVLDLMIGEEDGLEICARLRAQGQTLPILMLTAKGDPLDKVAGLETVLTITSPNHSCRVNWWRGSMRCCVARRSPPVSSP